MALKAAFQMDKDVKVGKDLTVEFIRQAHLRSHLIFFYSPQQIAIKNNTVLANACPIIIENDQLKFGSQQELPLNDMDIVFIRQNPPFDMRYITTTYILEHLQKPLLINDPKSIRDCPEKLFPLLFPQFIPPTLITEDSTMIISFYNEYKDIVLKPLYSYGGSDVLRVHNQVDIKVIAELMITKHQCPIIAQQFCTNINHDKRIVILDGKPIGVMKRKVLSQNEIRTNLCLGSIPEHATLSNRDMEICSSIGPELIKRNITFAGIDIFNDYLLEINITSPCGIIQMNKLYNVSLEETCWDLFERKVLTHSVSCHNILKTKVLQDTK